MEKFEGLFTISDTTTEERYDLSKFMPFKGDTYDVLNSPFLIGLKKLPIWRYYRVNEGYKDIDQISYDAYGTLFYARLIQYYNDTTKETFEDDTVLNLFSVEALETLYMNLSNGNLEDLT
jgi:hypothetical protein